MMYLLQPTAEKELAAATDWYEDKRESAAYDFVTEVQATLSRIVQNPELYAVCYRYRSGRILRRASVPRFPYSVIFEVRANYIFVVAFAHGKRRTNYWRRHSS